MPTKFKFYYDLMSQPSRALYIYLNLSKIPYEGVPVALRKGKDYNQVQMYFNMN